MENENQDPFAEAAKAPRAWRLGGAALFVVAAVAGISTIKACRKEPEGLTPPAAESVQPRP